MRKLIFYVLVLVVFAMCRKKNDDSPPIEIPVKTNSHLLVADTQKINEAFNGYYIALPKDYSGSGKKYPLLLFLHGLGQRGNGHDELKYLLFDGIGKVVKDDRLPASFRVKGENFSFIIVSPQYNKPPNEEEVIQMLDLIVAKYRIKTNRVYLAGLSLGARISTLVAAKYPKRFSAVLPIAGVAITQGLGERCRSIANANLPLWELHNHDDPMADVNDARRFIDSINSYSPKIPPRFTIFDKYGHDAWSTALDTAYREDGKNVYEWMLQYYR